MHGAEIIDVALLPERVLALSAGMEPVVRAWDLGKGTPLERLAGVPRWGDAVALSDDGLLALVGSEGGTVQLWKVPSPKNP
jgi:WD40 repeat protein